MHIDMAAPSAVSLLLFHALLVLIWLSDVLGRGFPEGKTWVKTILVIQESMVVFGGSQ